MSRVVWLLTGAVVALEVPYPLVHGHVRNALTVATVVVFAATSLTHVVLSSSTATAISVCAVFGAGGFLAEVLGVHTGLPFGSYHYTGGLGPELAGVPVIIALAWLMMAWPATCVAAQLTAQPASRVAVGSIALAAWDVFLDPQMVAAHHWRWSDPTPHLPGMGEIPLTNFAGWLGVAVILMVLLHLLLGPPRIRDDRPMLTLWIWTWLSSALANLAFFHRPAVAAWGFLAMGVVGGPLLMSLARPVRTAR